MFNTFNGMPKGVKSLFFIQAFSTFSYAVLYSSLALYLSKQIGLAPSKVNQVVGLFLSFNYILQLLGGLIGGRYLSNRVLFLLTGVIQILGLIVLAIAYQSLLYLGLSLFLIGCGLNFTSFNSMLTQQFSPGDSRQSGAFFLSYAVMNIGFFAGYTTSGFFDFSNQYQLLLCICIVTNALSILFLSSNWHHLSDRNTPLTWLHNKTKIAWNKSKAMIILLLLIPTMYIGFHLSLISNILIFTTSLVMFLLIFMFGLKQDSAESKHSIFVYLILALGSIAFWTIYLTGPMGVTLFIKQNVNRELHGIEFATQWLRNINPIMIILSAPIGAWIQTKLKSKDIQLTVAVHFSFGFLFLACSFVCLFIGIHYANAAGYTSVYWVIAHMTLQGLAELMIGPIGLALVGQIAPIQLQGIMLGSWMLFSGVSATFAQYISNSMLQSELIDPLSSNPDFFLVFQKLSVYSLLGAILFYLISSRLQQSTNALVQSS
jgi:POT family proton-dependent oligopeptide transporter